MMPVNDARWIDATTRSATAGDAGSGAAAEAGGCRRRGGGGGDGGDGGGLGGARVAGGGAAGGGGGHARRRRQRGGGGAGCGGRGGGLGGVGGDGDAGGGGLGDIGRSGGGRGGSAAEAAATVAYRRGAYPAAADWHTQARPGAGSRHSRPCAGLKQQRGRRRQPYAPTRQCRQQRSVGRRRSRADCSRPCLRCCEGGVKSTRRPPTCAQRRRCSRRSSPPSPHATTMPRWAYRATRRPLRSRRRITRSRRRITRTRAATPCSSRRLRPRTRCSQTRRRGARTTPSSPAVPPLRPHMRRRRAKPRPGPARRGGGDVGRCHRRRAQRAHRAERAGAAGACGLGARTDATDARAAAGLRRFARRSVRGGAAHHALPAPVCRLVAGVARRVVGGDHYSRRARRGPDLPARDADRRVDALPLAPQWPASHRRRVPDGALPDLCAAARGHAARRAVGARVRGRQRRRLPGVGVGAAEGRDPRRQRAQQAGAPQLDPRHRGPRAGRARAALDAQAHRLPLAHAPRRGD